MLRINIGSLPNEIRSVDHYFDLNYETKWFDNDLNKKMILDVDKSEVIAPNIIESSVLGTIPPQWLSGGIKALMCMNSDDSGHVFNLSNCGDNCAKWVFEISKLKDLTVTTHHCMNFADIKNFNAYIINTGKHVHSNDEYLYEYANIVSDIVNSGGTF